jgi:membrane fusion protein (multidrug efflux system)
LSTPFSRTLRALDADRGLGGLLMATGAGLLLCWGLWLGLARVTVYADSEAARVESIGGARPLQAEVTGRVVAVFAQVGDPVLEGDPLIELDATALELELQAIDARQAALAVQVDALASAVVAAEAGLQGVAAAARQAEGEMGARKAEAEAAARQAEAEYAAAAAEPGGFARQEVDRLRASASSRRALSEAMGYARRHVSASAALDGLDRQGALATLQQTLAAATGELTAAQAELQRLDTLIERHQLRAPVSGTLGELRGLMAGDLVAAGELLGAVIPEGELGVVASFGPAALGRVAVGAAARVRLDAFPWTTHGSLPATVLRVASEPREGGLRVQLSLDDDGGLPLQHGLTGVVEVAVGDEAPAMLLLEAAGARASR